MQVARQQTLGLVIIGVLILVITLVRFWRVMHWSIR
jgi:hypothetical protein